MKRFLLLLFLINNLSGIAWAQESSLNPATAARLTFLADKLIPERLPLDGKFTCEYSFSPPNAIGNVNKFLAFGDTIEKAHFSSRLLCIKNQCETIGAQMKESILQLRSSGSESVQEILQGQGIEDRDSAANKVMNENLHKLSQSNCTNGSQFLKEAAVTPCLTTPLQCQNNSYHGNP